ncbi:Uncharacterised protein [uncultured archaeon]|nr:Uncharacterised protein [uncultured archaeon]
MDKKQPNDCSYAFNCHKKIFAAAIAVVILALFLSLILIPKGEEKKIEGNSQVTGAGSDKAESPQGGNPLLKQRESYGIPQAVFSNLPQPPGDFNAIVSLYHSGNFRDEEFFSEKYFLQPEFYPSFIGNGLTYWLNPDTTHWAAYGYGSFPTHKEMTIRQGEKKNVKFFMHSGYGVRSYQGIGLAASVVQAGKGVDVKIHEPAFLLGPNYPLFEKGWARQITLEITADANAQFGERIFDVRVTRPPAELSGQWGEKSPGAYFESGFVSMESPVYRLAVAVEPVKNK